MTWSHDLEILFLLGLAKCWFDEEGDDVEVEALFEVELKPLRLPIISPPE